MIKSRLFKEVDPHIVVLSGLSAVVVSVLIGGTKDGVVREVSPVNGVIIITLLSLLFSGGVVLFRGVEDLVKDGNWRYLVVNGAVALMIPIAVGCLRAGVLLGLRSVGL